VAGEVAIISKHSSAICLFLKGSKCCRVNFLLFWNGGVFCSRVLCCQSTLTAWRGFAQTAEATSGRQSDLLKCFLFSLREWSYLIEDCFLRKSIKLNMAGNIQSWSCWEDILQVCNFETLLFLILLIVAFALFSVKIQFPVWSTWPCSSCCSNSALQKYCCWLGGHHRVVCNIESTLRGSDCWWLRLF